MFNYVLNFVTIKTKLKNKTLIDYRDLFYLSIMLLN